MATIKSYTDLEQSRKLAEILPLESADMRFCFSHTLDGRITGHYPMIGSEPSLGTVPCWSLVALLSVLPKEVEIDGQRYAPCLFPIQDKWLLKLWYNSNHTITSPIAIFSDNPVDACVAMIERLHELNLL